MPSFLRRASEAFNGGSGSDLSMFPTSLPTFSHEKRTTLNTFLLEGKPATGSSSIPHSFVLLIIMKITIPQDFIYVNVEFITNL
ncbi:hypothetical protein Bca101_019080 [Brassica carinata]